MDPAALFITSSRRFLQRSYLPKIERCMDALSEEELWWRPNDRSNSIGNLVLHLAGNVRQYIISGAGGAPDIRMRDEEFAARDVVTKDDLRTMLRDTLEEVDGTLARLDASVLRSSITVQGRELTVLEAIYHAVEHFSMHTGQIIYIAKQLKHVDLKFYSFDKNVVHRNY
jgi:uncharacterized damage-inducible protein DinB